ncbi:ABC transporter ATP-binding protein [Endomicrobium proavitum]|uniref:Vitamin B12 ABC transporter, ATPase component BtuD n=1 Tax=Endomicrobium proavitum TaxID=1408281 RepID=A0A0G3WGH0_9BACT|nr:ABC transporter ATP-binding protein [Endomicrobium proavitum]AKL97776.1 Vitamin B12 ABC transporter, ATPase component BtuD [Endomicrobium proavitum]
MINVKNIFAGYQKHTPILKDVSFNIPKGSFAGIIGRNGAGKSTLLKTLCNLLKLSSGAIEINNKNINSVKKSEFAKTVAFMPQSIDTVFPFSVKDFVLLGRYPYMNVFKIPSKKDLEAVGNVLEFTGIKVFENRNINELSGGEKQKVLIAQTLAQETDIIVLDEPTSHLDIGSQNDILELLRVLNEKHNKTIITTLHDLNAAGEFCSKIILMDGGKIRNAGAPEEVLNYKDIESVYKTRVVVKTNPMSGKPYVIPVKRQSEKLKV